MSWPVQKLRLSAPSLQELYPIISKGLQSNFQDVTVEVCPCPDLREKPFCLAAEGLCGHARIADIGGPPNLSPTPKLDKRYGLLDMAKLMELSDQKGFLLGASAGPFHVLGHNSEGMPNLSYKDGQVVDNTHYAEVTPSAGCHCAKISSPEFGLMGNLFGCDGSPGDVLHLVAKTRTGKLNFTSAIQDALKAHYADRTISMGGVFVITKGKASLHVMPDFSKTPLESREEVEQWLRYFDFSAPLTCLSVFHSHDPDLDLRMEHTHCFSDHNEGGHYHDDVTPDEVEYEAYFNVAQAIYRIDRP